MIAICIAIFSKHRLPKWLCFLILILIFASCSSSNDIAPSPKISPDFADYEVAEIHFQKACCDGSASIALDKNHFLVANDENSTLHIYARNGNENPIFSLDIRKFLGLKKKNDEADLEGMTRIGSRIFVIASHSRSKKGVKKKGRRQLFALQFDLDKRISIRPFGKPFTKLLDTISAARLIEGANWKTNGNIEGLASTPNGGLLIGFRTPSHKGKTILIELTNPGEVITGGKPILGKARLILLGGMGVRGMERFGDTYVIASESERGKYPQLFFWDGKDDRPRRLFARLPKDLNPESVLLFPDTGLEEIHILSDDGNAHINSRLCNDIKDENKRSFRRIILTTRSSEL